MMCCSQDMSSELKQADVFLSTFLTHSGMRKFCVVDFFYLPHVKGQSIDFF